MQILKEVQVPQTVGYLNVVSSFSQWWEVTKSEEWMEFVFASGSCILAR